MIQYSRFLFAICVTAIGLVGCADPPDQVEVTETAMRSPFRPPVDMNASSEDRFRLALPQQEQQAAHPAPMVAQSADGEQPKLFHYDVPEGWVEEELNPMRLINLRFGENLEGELYLSLLPGGGGGIAANVNRWRGQLGLQAMSDAEVAALPSKKLFGRDAPFIDFEGTFSGMGDPTPKPGYRMLGVLLEHQDRGIFVKMVGPAADVEREKAGLDLVLDTIHIATDGHTHDDKPTASAPQASAPPSAASGHGGTHDGAGGVDFMVPAGWNRTGDRPMRLVTFTMGDSECYITILGPNGNLLANLNRWLGQFGKPPLDELAVAELPTIEVFGVQSPLLEATGDFTGMGGVSRPDQGLLAVACILPDKSVFIKMTGPQAEVASQRANFVAFCESLHTH